MEHKLMQLQDKTQYLTKENHDLKSKINKSDDKDKVSVKQSDNEKNLNKMLFNARRLLKEKERELDFMKGELQKQSSKTDSAKLI
jgi:hypothetical protein